MVVRAVGCSVLVVLAATVRGVPVVAAVLVGPAVRVVRWGWVLVVLVGPAVPVVLVMGVLVGLVGVVGCWVAMVVPVGLVVRVRSAF